MGSCRLAPALYADGDRLRRAPQVKSHSVMRQSPMPRLYVASVLLLTLACASPGRKTYVAEIPRRFESIGVREANADFVPLASEAAEYVEWAVSGCRWESLDWEKPAATYTYQLVPVDGDVFEVEISGTRLFRGDSFCQMDYPSAFRMRSLSADGLRRITSS